MDYRPRRGILKETQANRVHMHKTLEKGIRWKREKKKEEYKRKKERSPKVGLNKGLVWDYRHLGGHYVPRSSEGGFIKYGNILRSAILTQKRDRAGSKQWVSSFWRARGGLISRIQIIKKQSYYLGRGECHTVV